MATEKLSVQAFYTIRTEVMHVFPRPCGYLLTPVRCEHELCLYQNEAFLMESVATCPHVWILWLIIDHIIFTIPIMVHGKLIMAQNSESLSIEGTHYFPQSKLEHGCTSEGGARHAPPGADAASRIPLRDMALDFHRAPVAARPEDLRR